jgi:prolyl oligopeptidase
MQPGLAQRAQNYETRQIFYPAKDGVFIPMFVTYKKGLKLDGHNPTLLYGYGGFGKSLTPSFSLSEQVWLEQGGVLAVANVRGGGEYGQAWHEAARRGQRQTAIDDFCQAACWLSKSGYTNPKRLAIMGASNGGLLVAACAVQQPNLFGAVVCQAPLIDMLRYQHFGPGRAWIAEYGEAEESQAEFEWLYAYSPLHNIKEVAYPATLVTVPLADERVHPMHGLKFAATLQAHDRGTQPILLRLEVDNGHGLGKAAGQIIEELADIYSFMFHILDIEINSETVS